MTPPRPDAAVTVEEPDSGAPPDAGEPVVALPDAGGSWGAWPNPDAGTLDVRVYSSTATRIEVELFRQAAGAPAAQTAVLEANGAGVFSARLPLPDLAAPLYWGYRAYGPNWPYVPAFRPGSTTGFVADVDAQGNRFNPNKLLFDPFALELSHDPSTPAWRDGRVYQTGAANRATDSAPYAPKGVVLAAPRPDFGARPARPFKDAIIYEVHVRGLTANDTSLPENLRGTYAGAAQRARALADLGVTTIELMPLQETQNDTNDVQPTDNDGDNYWGYSTLSYFAPDRRYASDRSPGGPTREVQAMVRAFHEAGIEVLVDVVYNHTGEGGLVSLRGLDNAGYYSLNAGRQGYENTNGVGPNVNTRSRAGQALIVESLKYWHEVLGFDGFRFDLAPVLGNGCEHGCFRYTRDDAATAVNRLTAALPNAHLIAEPWAIGNGGYQLGNFPKRWAEWNGQYRDTVRSMQNMLGVEATPLQSLLMRLVGSPDLFQDDGRGPAASVNYLVCHDGFTLSDLYACNAKSNAQAWPYGPSNGGEDHNRSWDQGGDPANQRRAARTGLALLLTSAGVPMFNGGDEQLRSVRCNNNAYNLDSNANWLSFPLQPHEATFRTFVQRMIAFRRAHPALRPESWWRGNDGNGNGLEQVRWFQPSGAVADTGYLGNTNNHALAWRLDGTELGESGAVYVAYNGWTGALDFTLPAPVAGQRWFLAGDTCNATEGPDQLAAPGAERELGVAGVRVNVCGRGVALVVSR